MNESAPAAPIAAPAPAQVAASATVTAAPVTAPAVATGTEVAAVRCENCGAPVPGKYCGTCGQRLEAPVHSLWHFTRLATEDLTHADSRLWHTLGTLLFRPDA